MGRTAPAATDAAVVRTMKNSYKISGGTIKARPHPGPLPQERENFCRADIGETGAFIRPPITGAIGKEAAKTEPTEELPASARLLSLSPGERVGVRASVVSD